MKILITGCQGFIGKSLALYAIQNGHKVLGVTRSKAVQSVPEITIQQCSLDSNEFISLINRFKPDMIYHSAGSSSVGYSFQQPRDDFKNAVDTWSSVLEAVRKSELNPLLMFPSSASIYGNPKVLPVEENALSQPISPYGFHKVISEQLAREYCQCFDMNVVITRLFSAYGPMQKRLLIWELFKQAINQNEKELIIQGTGNETRDFLYIDDICYYSLKLMESRPTGYLAVNVASGKSSSVREMAEIILALTGSKQTIRTLNKNLPGDPKKWQADIKLLQKLVPYQPPSIQKNMETCIQQWLAL